MYSDCFFLNWRTLYYQKTNLQNTAQDLQKTLSIETFHTYCDNNCYLSK